VCARPNERADALQDRRQLNCRTFVAVYSGENVAEARMLPGLVITVVLALAGAAGLVVLGQRAAAAGSPFDVAAGDRPALVHLVLTRCLPQAAGYEATILDLAGRGYLSVTGQAPAIGAVEHAGLWLAPAAPAAGSPALLSFEQQVLDDVRARVSDARGAPFDALAEACRVDATGIWEPFEDKLRAASRELGVCGPRLPVTASSVVLAFGTAAAIVTSASLAEPSHRGGAAVAAVIACWVGLAWLGRDRPTRAGSALADRWREYSGLPPGWDSSPAAGLRQSAYAVAAGRETGGSLLGRRRAGTPSGTAKPAQAWSSFTGSWRRVPIGPRPGGALRRGGGLLTGAGVLGFISIPFVITGDHRLADRDPGARRPRAGRRRCSRRPQDACDPEAAHLRRPGHRPLARGGELRRGERAAGQPADARHRRRPAVLDVPGVSGRLRPDGTRRHGPGDGEPAFRDAHQHRRDEA
jgi:hypothetical protein